MALTGVLMEGGDGGRQVRMRQTNLIQVDTYRYKEGGGKDGGRPRGAVRHLHENAKWRSALEIIVVHEVPARAV